VGGFARFSRGRLEMTDFSGAYTVKARELQTGGGVRLKFLGKADFVTGVRAQRGQTGRRLQVSGQSGPIEARIDARL